MGWTVTSIWQAQKEEAEKDDDEEEENQHHNTNNSVNNKNTDNNNGNIKLENKDSPLFSFQQNVNSEKFFFLIFFYTSIQECKLFESILNIKEIRHPYPHPNKINNNKTITDLK